MVGHKDKRHDPNLRLGSRLQSNVIHPDNKVSIEAKYLLPKSDDTETEAFGTHTLNSSEFELKDGPDLTNANDYTIQWNITSAHTADITVSIDKAIAFKVAQAQIADAALTYNTTVYDRHDWS